MSAINNFLRRGRRVDVVALEDRSDARRSTDMAVVRTDR